MRRADFSVHTSVHSLSTLFAYLSQNQCSFKSSTQIKNKNKKTEQNKTKTECCQHAGQCKISTKSTQQNSLELQINSQSTVGEGGRVTRTRTKPAVVGCLWQREQVTQGPSSAERQRLLQPPMVSPQP